MICCIYHEARSAEYEPVGRAERSEAQSTLLFYMGDDGLDSRFHMGEAEFEPFSAIDDLAFTIETMYEFNIFDAMIRLNYLNTIIIRISIIYIVIMYIVYDGIFLDAHDMFSVIVPGYHLTLTWAMHNLLHSIERI